MRIHEWVVSCSTLQRHTTYFYKLIFVRPTVTVLLSSIINQIKLWNLAFYNEWNGSLQQLKNCYNWAVESPTAESKVEMLTTWWQR